MDLTHNRVYQLVELLLKKGAAVDTRDEAGRTALHYAARRGHEELLQLLLEKEAAVHARDDEGRTGLHYAATNGAQGGSAATT
jgi:ankyrin repeat protein